MIVAHYYGVIVHITSLIEAGLVDKEFLTGDGRMDMDSEDYYKFFDKRSKLGELDILICSGEEKPSDESILNVKPKNSKYIFSEGGADEIKYIMSDNFVYIVEPITKGEFTFFEDIKKAKFLFERKFPALKLGDLSNFEGVGMHTIVDEYN